MVNREKRKQYYDEMKNYLLNISSDSSLKGKDYLIEYMSSVYADAVSGEDSKHRSDENGNWTYENYCRLNMDCAIAWAFCRFFYDTISTLGFEIKYLICEFNGVYDKKKLYSKYGEKYSILEEAIHSNSYSEILEYLISTRLYFDKRNRTDERNHTVKQYNSRFILANFSETELKELVNGYCDDGNYKNTELLIEKTYSALGFPGKIYTYDEVVEMQKALNNDKISIEEWVKYMGTYVDRVICMPYYIPFDMLNYSFLKKYIGISEEKLPENVKELYEKWLANKKVKSSR